MLGRTDAIANVAVKDLAAARTFYQRTLGLTPVDGQESEVIVFTSGQTRLFVYRSEYAGTNKATTVSWVVDDVGKTVAELAQKGVVFEHYDMPGLTRHGDVHTGGGMQVAWFKDPDGNILSVVNG